MNNQHILLEYHDFKKEYVSRYGEKTIILMQIGTFYEMCAVIDDDVQYGEVNIYNICESVLLSIAHKKYKYDEFTQKEYLQAGFPIVSQDKYMPLLLNQGYKLIIVDQITEKPNIERKVTLMLSPGINMKYTNSNKTSNYFMSIYIEKYTYKSKDNYRAGISTIDLGTGKNYIHDIHHSEDLDYWKNEISRLILFYNPSELLFQLQDIVYNLDDIINEWDIGHSCIQINYFNDNIYKQPSYQDNYLQKFFKIDTMLSMIDYFELTHKKETCNSYIYMLAYINEHKNDILNNIEIPREYRDMDYLLLNSNSIRQLNIVNNYSYYKGKNESLLEICNKSKTPMGKRLFKEKLLYPSINIDEIKKSYNCIEICRKDKFYEELIKKLKYVSDLEKSLRFMGLFLLSPYDLYSTYLSYGYVNDICRIIKNNDIWKYYNNYEETIEIFNEYYNKIKDTFKFDNINNVPILSMEYSIFNRTIISELDEIEDEIVMYKDHFNHICTRLSEFIDNKKVNSIKYDNDKDNWFIYCTNKRSETFKNKLKNIGNNMIHVKDDTGNILYSIHPSQFTYKKKDGSNKLIECDLISNMSIKLFKLQNRLSKLNEKYYNEFITDSYSKYNEPLKKLHKLISEIDFYSAGAKISIEYNYCKPKIVSGKSFMDYKGIRHPIVERINTETEYITNDISIGTEKGGVLLYGTNACGKSTLMKAIGLNIIMAQAGLYVACDSFEYAPYKQIFTRILNNDNIFRSQSSFAVEMEEIRGILQRADDSSLVLGDELCSGTETISALSIVSAGLQELSMRKTSFMFTSHLHQLIDIPTIKEISNLQIYHLKINHIDGVLIYDRKLAEGPGPSIYGLKVCEALGLPKKFIEQATKIQLKLENKFKPKISPYNKNVIVDRCYVCNENAKDTHHINEQCMADENGMIKHFHKNDPHNLAPLCKKCHNDTTYGKLIIEGYVMTGEGKKLKYYYAENKKKSKKKFNEEQIENIQKYRNTYEQSINNCIMLLDKDGIQISITLLKKIMDNEY